MTSAKTLTRSLAHFFSGTMLSRISGMMRDIVMGSAFGSAPIVSAFLVAFRFANLPRRLFGEGAMHAAFIPQYEELKKGDAAAADRFFRDVTYACGLACAVLALLVWVFLPATTPVLRFTRLFIPFLPFICGYGLNLAYHNCQGAFFKPNAAPILFNLMWIGGSLLLWGGVSEKAMTSLTLMVGAGMVLQWAVVALPLWRKLSWRGVHLWSPAIKRCARALGLAMLGVGAAQINSALDPLFAYATDGSAPAHLWYAIRLQQLPLALFGVALASVILPPLSRASGEEWEGVLRWGRRRAFELMAPCTVAIFVCALPAVTLLFFRGQFTAGDCQSTAFCLAAYGVGLVPMALTFLRTAAFQSRGDYRTPALASALAVAVNIVLNTLFIFALHWPGASVALATSLSAYFHASFLKARLGERGWRGSFGPWIASLSAGVGALAVDHLVFGGMAWERGPSPGTLHNLVLFALPAFAFLAVYGALMGRRLLNPTG